MSNSKHRKTYVFKRILLDFRLFLGFKGFLRFLNVFLDLVFNEHRAQDNYDPCKKNIIHPVRHKIALF